VSVILPTAAGGFVIWLDYFSREPFCLPCFQRHRQSVRERLTSGSAGASPSLAERRTRRESEAPAELYTTKTVVVVPVIGIISIAIGGAHCLDCCSKNRRATHAQFDLPLTAQESTVALKIQKQFMNSKNHKFILQS